MTPRLTVAAPRNRNVESLDEACGPSVRSSDIGVGFAAMFDGATPYPPFASDSEDAA